MKKSIQIYIRNLLIILFISLIFLGLGIFLLIKGFSLSEFLMILGGGVLVVIGGYGSIVCLRRCVTAFFLSKVAKVIEEKRRIDVNELAVMFKTNSVRIDKHIMLLIKGDFISGFYYDHHSIENIVDRNERLAQGERKVDDEKLQAINEQQKQLKAEDPDKLSSSRCESCGANVVFKGEDTVCPYCGNLLVSKTNRIIR